MQENLGGGSSAAASGNSDFEWVNVWARQERPDVSWRHNQEDAPATVHVLRASFAADALRAASDLDAEPEAREAALLAEFLADIEQARDALYRQAEPPTKPAAPAFRVVLRRTSNTVPVILGSMLGMLMLVVFSTAAMFVRFAR